jgi:hypothetical protein
LKRKHPKSIKNKSPTMASDSFKFVNLHGCEKTKALNPLVTLINQNYLYNQPSDATKEIGVQVNIDEINPHDIDAFEEIHIYDEIQPSNPLLEAMQHSVQVDIHAHEIQPPNPLLEAMQDSVQDDIYTFEKIHVYQEIQPPNPLSDTPQDSVQVDIHAHEIQPPKQIRVQADIHAHEEIHVVQADVHASTTSSNPSNFVQKKLENDSFEEIDLHSSAENSEEKEINPTFSGLFGCLRKWL